MRTLRALALAAALAGPQPAAAQEGLSMGQVQSPVLTVDVDRLFADTRYGQRLRDDLGARAAALDAENERIVAEFRAEELRLAEQRPEMEPDAFRALADDFDARAQRTRAEQDAKGAEIEAAVERERAAFLSAATPVLARLMAESGAAVILDRRSVFLSAGVVDVTDEAVDAIDAELGAGGGEAAAESTPAPSPDPSGAAAPVDAPPVDEAPDEAAPGDGG